MMILAVTFVVISIQVFAQSCSQFNQTFGPFPYTGPSGTLGHATGDHLWYSSYGGTCSYSGTGGCTVLANANSGGSTSESGTRTNPLYTHYGNVQTVQGSGSANSGGGVTVDTETAAAFRSCLFSCAVNIGVSGSGNGAGFTASFPPDAIYADKQYYKVSCSGQTYTAAPPPPSCPPTQSGGGGGGKVKIWHGREPRLLGIKARLLRVQTGGTGTCSPILIDVTGHGFHLTDPNTNCVLFDLQNDGNPGCFSWPRADSGNAWLVYDRDNDNKVDSGAELFGDFTPHSDGDYLPQKWPKPNPGNGFVALMWFDQKEQGGNGDLVIDARDKIWPKLKLWIDKHCTKHPGQVCSARKNELHSLDEFGIHSLSVVYSPDLKLKVDKYGNQFRFYAQVNPKPHEKQLPDDELNEKRMYDVYLVKK